MSHRVISRAPGKVFLLGEYAVLGGCPAVVAAVNRHVEVSVTPRPKQASVRIRSEELNAQVEFPIAQPPALHGPLRFAIAALNATSKRLSALTKMGLEIAIASTLVEPDSHVKPGLGGSAAVTVAMVAGLAACAGEPLSRNELFALAYSAHRLGQNGIGSGADVAASCYGGVVAMQVQGDQTPSIQRLTLPTDTSLLVGWTGEASSTTNLVQRYLAAGNGHASHRADFAAESRACVDVFIESLLLRLISMTAINSAGEALIAMGKNLDLPISTPRLIELVRIARACGAAAKLSGAGGGDCGIALTQSHDIAERVRADWQAAGIVPLSVQIDHQGVTVVDG